MHSFRNDPFFWLNELHLHRHPLKATIPAIAVLAVIFLAWRGASKRLRGSFATNLSLALAGAVTGLLLVSGFIYARSWFFLDHVEPNVVGIAEMFATGRPIYHAQDSASRYALLYGPNLFILYGLILKLTSFSIPALKVAVIVGLAVAVVLALRAYRRVTAHAFAWLGVAYVMFALGSYADLPLWVRAEPALLILTAGAMLAALRCGPLAGAIWIGFAAGFAINIKAHAPLYLVCAWMLFPHRWRIRSLLIAAIVCTITAVLPFVLFREQASIELYMTWLRAAGKHGLNLSYLARNVEVLIYLIAPVIALCGLTWATRRGAIVDWMKQQAAFVIATIVTIGMVSIVASKPGAGPWHLMPFIIPLGLIVAKMTELLSQRDERGADAPVFWVAAAQSIIGGFVLFSVFIALIRVPFVVRDMRSVDDRAIVAELRQAVANHPGRHVYLGVGGSGEYTMSYFRPVLVGLGQPYLLDYAAVMDMKLSGLPMPRATLDEIASDRSAIWLFPRDSNPFTVPSIYNSKAIAFDEEFRMLFDANFHRTDSTPHFDVWTSRIQP